MSNVFEWPVRVYYEDTDAAGVVYYANYLKFLERARTELLRQKGFEQDELIRNHNVIFVVRSVNMDYLAPACFNDQVVVVTRIIKSGKVSIEFEQDIVQKNDNKTLCKGKIKIASLDAKTFKPVAMPAVIRTILNQEFSA